MTSPEDKLEFEQRLQEAAQGGELAWQDIVNHYSPRVFALLRAQCGDPDLAEEIAQSTFCTIAAKIGSYTELGKFEPWLFRIAMNRLRDEMRRRKRQARPVEDQALTALAGTTDDNPSEDAPEPAELEALRKGLRELSDAEQTVIHLRFYAGLSFKQIAELLDQPLGTILARHFRTLKKLGESVGKPADNDEEDGP